jgi:hypothetical protein
MLVAETVFDDDNKGDCVCVNVVVRVGDIDSAFVWEAFVVDDILCVSLNVAIIELVSYVVCV